jgi:hypothetical protein
MLIHKKLSTLMIVLWSFFTLFLAPSALAQAGLRNQFALWFRLHREGLPMLSPAC